MKFCLSSFYRKNFTSSGVVDSPVEDTPPPPPKHLKRENNQQPQRVVSSKAKKNILSRFPCKTRFGMSCAVDTAWQKRGFDSLSGNYPCRSITTELLEVPS